MKINFEDNEQRKRITNVEQYFDIVYRYVFGKYVYIGSTSQSIYERHAQHKYRSLSGEKNIFHQTFAEYEKQHKNYTLEILCLTPKGLGRRFENHFIESQWMISKENSLNTYLAVQD